MADDATQEWSGENQHELPPVRRRPVVSYPTSVRHSSGRVSGSFGPLPTRASLDRRSTLKLGCGEATRATMTWQASCDEDRPMPTTAAEIRVVVEQRFA